jgi:hypothetical protein
MVRQVSPKSQMGAFWTYWAIGRAYAEWYKSEYSSHGRHMTIHRAVVIIEPTETLDLADLGGDEYHDSIRYTFDDDGDFDSSHPRLVEASECGIRWVTWRCTHPCCAAPFKLGSSSISETSRSPLSRFEALTVRPILRG